eukprot:Awhi_evm1s14973
MQDGPHTIEEMLEDEEITLESYRGFKVLMPLDFTSNCFKDTLDSNDYLNESARLRKSNMPWFFEILENLGLESRKEKIQEFEKKIYPRVKKALKVNKEATEEISGDSLNFLLQNARVRTYEDQKIDRTNLKNAFDQASLNIKSKLEKIINPILEQEKHIQAYEDAIKSYKSKEKQNRRRPQTGRLLNMWFDPFDKQQSEKELFGFLTGPEFYMSVETEVNTVLDELWEELLKITEENVSAVDQIFEDEKTNEIIQNYLNLANSEKYREALLIEKIGLEKNSFKQRWHEEYKQKVHISYIKNINSAKKYSKIAVLTTHFEVKGRLFLNEIKGFTCKDSLLSKTCETLEKFMGYKFRPMSFHNDSAEISDLHQHMLDGFKEGQASVDRKSKLQFLSHVERFRRSLKMQSEVFEDSGRLQETIIQNCRNRAYDHISWCCDDLYVKAKKIEKVGYSGNCFTSQWNCEDLIWNHYQNSPKGLDKEPVYYYDQAQLKLKKSEDTSYSGALSMAIYGNCMFSKQINRNMWQRYSNSSHRGRHKGFLNNNDRDFKKFPGLVLALYCCTAVLIWLPNTKIPVVISAVEDEEENCLMEKEIPSIIQLVLLESSNVHKGEFRFYALVPGSNIPKPLVWEKDDIGKSYKLMFQNFLPNAKEMHIEMAFINYRYQYMNLCGIIAEFLKQSKIASKHISLDYQEFNYLEADEENMCVKLSKQLERNRCSFRFRQVKMHCRGIVLKLTTGISVRIGADYFHFWKAPTDDFSMVCQELRLINSRSTIQYSVWLTEDTRVLRSSNRKQTQIA